MPVSNSPIDTAAMLTFAGKHGLIQPKSVGTTSGPLSNLSNLSKPTSNPGSNLTISTEVGARIHPVPEDSILADYRDYVRRVSEAPDALIVAPMLVVCARLMTPGVHWDFAGHKPLTLFHFIVTPAGMRKTTSFNPAEAVARRILLPEDFIVGNASDSALFKSFEANPHRLQLEDEGNTILQTWAGAQYGREVSGRYLKLYDGKSWGQNFHREGRDHDDKNNERFIDCATLSLCLGATFGVSQFQGIDAATGLRRRFGYYVATKPARVIVWPQTFDDQVAERFAQEFRKLKTLTGRLSETSLTNGGRGLWSDIQQDNRERASALGLSRADEAQGSALNESPARILKLATIFQACRWAKGAISNWQTIDEQVLQIAWDHQNACLEASAELDTVGRRAAIAESAETILAKIRADFSMAPYLVENELMVDKSALTARYAHHTSRRGALTSHELHDEIMPALIRDGEARIAERIGKRVVYAVKAI